jgi:predicted GNAT superfamily acetyltransferase
MAPEFAWALAHAGNYVALAHHDGADIGGALGFLGRDDDGAVLHSHMAGVVPSCQGGSVGFALKQHQRDWALEQGITRITWTFDPLIARNAYFNVVKLGAGITRFYVDFYGPLTDGINAGDETDRCFVTWSLDSAAAAEAAAGRTKPADGTALLAAGAAEALAVGPAGEPVCAAAASRSDPDVLLCQVPRDAVELRRTDPALARAWRVAVRDVLGPALADGYAVASVTRDGHYVLTRSG